MADTLLDAVVLINVQVSTNWYWQLSYKSVIRIRAGLLDLLTQKMLRLRQEKGVESKVMTMMISDVQRIMSALSWVHELWVTPVETGLGIWLLWLQLGPSSLTVLGLALGMLTQRFDILFQDPLIML